MFKILQVSVKKQNYLGSRWQLKQLKWDTRENIIKDYLSQHLFI